MKAVILKAPKELELVDDWPEPECGPDEVIIRIRSVGLCGTDLSAIDGKSTLPEYPGVVGHEGGGEIVEVGASVTDRHVGQRVVVEPNFPCGACVWCTAGRSSLCESKIGSVGFTWPGLLSEYFVAPARFTWPVPDNVPDVALGCIEPLVVGVTAVKRSGIRAGEDALITGAGSVGQLVAQALRAIGAQGHVQDPHEGRVATALRLGAKRADEYEGDDFPYIFETSGVSAVWPIALQKARRGGVITAIGLAHQPVEISPLEIVLRQLTLRGNMIYDHPADFAETIRLLGEGTLVAEEPVEARYGFADSLEAIAKVRETPGKTVIELP